MLALPGPSRDFFGRTARGRNPAKAPTGIHLIVEERPVVVRPLRHDVEAARARGHLEEIGAVRVDSEQMRVAARGLAEERDL